MDGWVGAGLFSSKWFDIEELFRNLKSGGYNLEETRVTDDRLIGLLVLMTLAYSMTTIEAYVVTPSGFTSMQTLTKNCILNENQNAIAVQISIAEFKHLEELLENYGLLQLMNDPIDSDRLSKTDALK